MTFSRDTYCRRIGLDGCAVSASGLRALQTAQLYAIPFENIDVLLGHVPDLSPDSLAERFVAGRRGGYCFELNGLFGMALNVVGFRCRPVLGRVRMGAASGGPRAHLAWIVSVDGEDWLCDCGFGGPGPLEPLRIDGPRPDVQPNGAFRLTRDDVTGERVLQRKAPNGWFSLYGFDNAAVSPTDIEAANFLCARWEEAPFSSNLMMNRPMRGGRVSLFNTTFRNESPGSVREATLTSADELQGVLVDGFGIPLNRVTAEQVWERVADRRSPLAA